jgi:hypothetical protein
MAPLRSTSFYQGTPPVVGGVNTWTTVYTVPVGKVVILKNAHMYNPNVSAHSWGVRLSAALVIEQTSLASGAAVDRDWWVVLNPGETLQVLQVVASTITYYLSGYLLYI